MSQETESNIINKNQDCLSCKLISSSVTIGCGIYIIYHSKKSPNKIGKSIMMLIGSAALALGTARFLDFSPFRNQSDENDIS